MSWWVLIYALIFLLQFFLIELLKRHLGIKAELTRKIIHLLSGLIVATMPWMIEGQGIMILSASFLVLLIFSKSVGMFSSIHGVKRKTLGEFAFATSPGLAAWIMLPEEPFAFSFGFLILAFSDTAAEWIGSWKPILQFKVFGSIKSLGGSTAFLIVSFALCLIWSISLGIEISYAGMLMVGVSLSIVEFIQPYGLDDLSLPVIAGLMYPMIFQ